jgi:hypothetical protein
MKVWKGKGKKPTQKGLCLNPEMSKPIHPFLGARKVFNAVLEPVENSEDMTDNEEDEDATVVVKEAIHLGAVLPQKERQLWGWTLITSKLTDCLRHASVLVQYLYNSV